MQFPCDFSKLEQWTGAAGGEAQDRSPGAQVWNPGLLEITLPCLQPEDQTSRWATLIHHMRLNAVQYEDATKLPLHLESAIQEYLPATWNGPSGDSEDLD